MNMMMNFIYLLLFFFFLIKDFYEKKLKTAEQGARNGAQI
jgi:hypothetical protein